MSEGKQIDSHKDYLEETGKMVVPKALDIWMDEEAICIEDGPIIAVPTGESGHLLPIIVDRYNSHNQLVEALKTIQDASFADAAIPDWPTLIRGVAYDALKAAGEDI